MTKQDALAQLGPYFLKHPKTPGSVSLDSVEQAIGSSLPTEYKEFLAWSNGGETLPPLIRFRFYPVEELLPRRGDGQPVGMIEIGTNDSAGFAFELQPAQPEALFSIVTYPLGETSRDEITPVATNFTEFLRLVLAPERGGK